MSRSRNTNTEFRDAALLCHLCPGMMPSDLLNPATVQAIQNSVTVDPDQASGGHSRPAHAGRRELAGRARGADADRAGQLAWWRGDGTPARLALDRALGIDPGYRRGRRWHVAAGGR